VNHPINHPKEPGGWGEPVEAEQQAPERDPMPKDRRRETDPAPFADPAETRDRR
jgi:hypothetical protein